ncbi:hypothetical protein AAZX31_06G244600 [Glycine max]
MSQLVYVESWTVTENNNTTEDCGPSRHTLERQKLTKPIHC